MNVPICVLLCILGLSLISLLKKCLVRYESHANARKLMEIVYEENRFYRDHGVSLEVEREGDWLKLELDDQQTFE